MQLVGKSGMLPKHLFYVAAAMVKKSFAHMACSLAQALDVVGEWWSMLIIRDFFLGKGERRFEQLRDSLGISRNILTERLKTLTDAEVIERVPLQEGGKRCTYKLTAKGRDLMPAMMALMQWGDKWQQDTPFVVVRDRESGQPVAPVNIRNQNDKPVTMDDLFVTLSGPGGDEVIEEWPLEWMRADADVERAS
jgi:DNA-binding HxlR family transcriptional regulator